jgi:hypothetical protein
VELGLFGMNRVFAYVLATASVDDAPTCRVRTGGSFFDHSGQDRFVLFGADVVLDTDVIRWFLSGDSLFDRLPRRAGDAAPQSSGTCRVAISTHDASSGEITG